MMTEQECEARLDRLRERMQKAVTAEDFAAIDRELDRLEAACFEDDLPSSFRRPAP